jgi:CheY-like chemotaxis protein
MAVFYVPLNLTSMKKILVVEDSPLFQFHVKKIIEEALRLAAAKCEIETAVEEAQAISLIKANNYCLITLDGNIKPSPNGHGINVLNALEGSDHLSRIIILSGDEFFIEVCQKKGIPAFQKSDLNGTEELAKLMAEKIKANF